MSESQLDYWSILKALFEELRRQDICLGYFGEAQEIDALKQLRPRWQARNTNTTGKPLVALGTTQQLIENMSNLITFVGDNFVSESFEMFERESMACSIVDEPATKTEWNLKTKSLTALAQHTLAEDLAKTVYLRSKESLDYDLSNIREQYSMVHAWPYKSPTRQNALRAGYLEDGSIQLKIEGTRRESPEYFKPFACKGPVFQQKFWYEAEVQTMSKETILPKQWDNYDLFYGPESITFGDIADILEPYRVPGSDPSVPFDLITLGVCTFFPEGNDATWEQHLFALDPQTGYVVLEGRRRSSFNKYMTAVRPAHEIPWWWTPIPRLLGREWADIAP